MSDTVKKLHLTPGQMRDAVARAAEDVKTLPPWREPKETTMAQNHNIGHTIRARRETAGLTQSALARKLGCADTMISRWESGRATPRQRYAEKLAVALGGVAADYHDQVTRKEHTMNTDPVEVSKARQALETAKIYWEEAIQCNMSKDVVHKRFLDYKRAQEAFFCAIRKAR